MGRVAVITGGSRGIGRACAEAFAEAGYSTIVLCRSAVEAAQQLTDSLRARGLDCAWYQCDVADAQQVKETFAAILKLYHRVDVLVNNAGVALIRLFTDTGETDWDRVFDVNVKGVYRCTQAVLPAMLDRQNGSIVNISSMWGEVGASCEVAYSASKAAVIGFTRALAKELGPSGIRVNCVSPGTIDTEMNAELDDEARAALANETPLERIGDPAEVAKAVLFLAGEGASFITGQVLGVSGGFIV